MKFDGCKDSSHQRTVIINITLHRKQCIKLALGSYINLVRERGRGGGGGGERERGRGGGGGCKKLSNGM